jgi:hypothetical protein
MKESASTALAYIQAHTEELGISPEALENHSIHIHVPEGAVPKDGPSAGITMLTAMVSAFSGRKVKPFLAMTGEITLRGQVLPVGGIKEKILAAKRAGMKDIVLCVQNEKDVMEINPNFIKGLRFHYVQHMNEVIEIALGKIVSGIFSFSSFCILHQNRKEMKRYLLIAILSVCNSIETQAQKRIISSWEELIDVKHKQDSSYFPKLLRDEALQNKLSEKVSFPELAKRKKLTETIELQLSIDPQGKIKDMEIKSEPNQLFDTSAIRLAMATSGYWKPAIREGIATEVDITTQIRFSILRSGSQMIKYAVSMLGLPAFIVDSTTNSPACLLWTNEDNDTTYYIHSKREDGSKVMLAQTYGTVTVGFICGYPW